MQLFSKKPAGEQETFLFVGLGNPGRKYRNNRHNIGFMVIDLLSEKLDIRISRMQSKALIGQGRWQGKKIILIKPQTFMNNSGQAVSSLMKFYKLPASNLMVAHDDLDLPFGTIRIRPSGGSGGQKGLASIIQLLGTKDFPRLRMGIGRPPGRMNAADYVLQDFSAGDQEMLDFVLDRATNAAMSFVENDLDHAMNQYNGMVEGK